MNWRRITQDELEVFLRKHKLWLMDEPGGERADLTRADLTGADLTRANLTRANLTGANLTRADLTRANLTRANLTRANLYGANLYGADLTRADLYGADLYGANLTRADLTRADRISEAKNVNYPIACPEKGSFTAFKKVRDGHIVELEIPSDAMRSSASSRKCRCSKAKVISITKIDGTPADVDVVYSKYDSDFAYKVGETIEVDDFDPDRWHECAPGIHFFITRQEAVNYIL